MMKAFKPPQKGPTTGRSECRFRLYKSSKEILSKLSDLLKMQTTQEHYGEIIDKRISIEMEQLKVKLTNIE